jgi:hypothetical protein
LSAKCCIQPTNCIAAGVSGKSCRLTVQIKGLGKVSSMGTMHSWSLKGLFSNKILGMVVTHWSDAATTAGKAKKDSHSIVTRGIPNPWV